MSRIVLAVIGLVLVLAAAASGREVILSTYIGSHQGDVVTGVGVQPDGTFVVGGTNGGQRMAVKSVLMTWVHGGAGYVMRISPKDNKVLSTVRFNGSVTDVDIGLTGEIFATGSFGAGKMAPNGKLLWTTKVRGDNARIVPGPNGSAVHLGGRMVTVLSAGGTVVKRFGVGGNHLEDVACDLRTGLIVTAGYDDYILPSGTKFICIPFVRAYDGRGKVVWTAYGWAGAVLRARNLLADCRAMRVAMGGDGKLYMLGDCLPGSTVFLCNSRNLDQRVPLVTGDQFQRRGGRGFLTFVVRLDVRTGASETGTFLRACGGKSNECLARALAAGPDGKVYVGGRSVNHPPVTDGAFAADVRVGFSAFFQILGPDLKRIYGTRFCAGSANSVAAGREGIIVGGEAEDSLPLLKPLQPDKGGGETDGWVVAYKTTTAAGE